MNNEYNIMDKVPPLRKFASLGSAASFNKKLKYLALLADYENWKYKNPKYDDNRIDESIAVLH